MIMETLSLPFPLANLVVEYDIVEHCENSSRLYKIDRSITQLSIRTCRICVMTSWLIFTVCVICMIMGPIFVSGGCYSSNNNILCPHLVFTNITEHSLNQITCTSLQMCSFQAMIQTDIGCSFGFDRFAFNNSWDMQTILAQAESVWVVYPIGKILGFQYARSQCPDTFPNDANRSQMVGGLLMVSIPFCILSTCFCATCFVHREVKRRNQNWSDLI